MNKKSLMVAAAITTLGVSGALGVNGVVNAATDTSSTDPMSSLVQKIADKFDLNKDEVQAVFDAQRDEMKARHEQEVKDRLAQAVKDGKITQEQSDKIAAKLKEMQSKREELKNKTMEERREFKEQKRDDMRQWASDNGISLDTLHDILGKPGMRMHGPGPMDEPKSDSQ
jgi:hypothetical protein